MKGVTHSLRLLRVTHFTDAQILAAGGKIQGGNVYFDAELPAFAPIAAAKIVERPPPETKEQRIIRVGPKLWEELHRWALTVDLSKADAAQWLVGFDRRVPCGICRQHFRAWTKANPPDFTTNVALFEWTYRGHLAAPSKLPKVTITLDEARAKWASP